MLINFTHSVLRLTGYVKWNNKKTTIKILLLGDWKFFQTVEKIQFKILPKDRIALLKALRLLEKIHNDSLKFHSIFPLLSV